MSKKGDSYEELVAEVISSFSHTYKVERQKSIVGPDGIRDRDVVIEGDINGKPYSILIECKDFSNRPVGISYIDALDSKTKDIGADKAFICSDSGFTANAISKAKRVGIGVISILKQGDARTSIQIQEEIYIRKVKILKINVSFPKREIPQLPPLEDVSYEGVPIVSWVYDRLMRTIGCNFTESVRFTDKIKFKKNGHFQYTSNFFDASEMIITSEVDVKWYSHLVIIDALSGIYDYIRRRATLTPGKNKYLIKGLDPSGGKLVDFVPPDNLVSGLQQGELDVNFCEIEGLDINKYPQIAKINDLISPEDLEPLISSTG